MDMDTILIKSSFVQKVYAVLSFILLIENFIRTGYSIPITLARTGIFLTIGVTLLVVGYIIGMILFYIVMLIFVFSFFKTMITQQNKRERERREREQWANDIADAIARRFGLT
jgi:choline-glycine betaine transporter